MIVTNSVRLEQSSKFLDDSASGRSEMHMIYSLLGRMNILNSVIGVCYWLVQNIKQPVSYRYKSLKAFLQQNKTQKYHLTIISDDKYVLDCCKFRKDILIHLYALLICDFQHFIFQCFPYHCLGGALRPANGALPTEPCQRSPANGAPRPP